MFLFKVLHSKHLQVQRVTCSSYKVQLYFLIRTDFMAHRTKLRRNTRKSRPRDEQKYMNQRKEKLEQFSAVSQMQEGTKPVLL